MNKLLIFPFSLIIIFSYFAFGQTKDSKIRLDKLIDNYSSQTIKVLNKNDDDFKYAVDNKNTFYDDLDSDGDFDAIVEVFFCEKSSCHPTTRWSELIVYLNNNNDYIFAASKGFSLFGKVNSIKDGKIFVDVYGLEENDPQCCPRLLGKEIYELRKNKLVKVDIKERKKTSHPSEDTILYEVLKELAEEDVCGTKPDGSEIYIGTVVKREFAKDEMRLSGFVLRMEKDKRIFVNLDYEHISGVAASASSDLSDWLIKDRKVKVNVYRCRRILYAYKIVGL